MKLLSREMQVEALGIHMQINSFSYQSSHFLYLNYFGPRNTLEMGSKFKNYLESIV